MLRVGEHLRGRPVLHDAPEVHDRDGARDVAHHGEVVGDEEHGHAELALQAAHQVEHRALDRDVERAGDLVGEDDVGPRGERPGERDALALPAGQLPRVGPLARRVDVDELEQPAHLRAPGRAPHPARDRLGHAVADRHPRVERGVRVLEDHLERPVPGALPQRLPVEQDRPARDRHQPDRRPRQRRLARAGLADQADDLPVGHGEVHPVDRGQAAAAGAVAHRDVRRTRSSLIGPPRRRPRPDSGIGSPACQQATRRPAPSATSGGSSQAVRSSASGQRAAKAQPAGWCAGSTGRPGMTGSGRSRSTCMSGTVASSARV